MSHEESVKLTDKAVKVLQADGPMKCGVLAKRLGFANGRTLSMLLQWRQGKVGDVGFSGGKWSYGKGQ